MDVKSTTNQTDGKLRDDTSGEVFTLLELSVIGRSRESAVPVPDPRVSRRHAMIRRQDDGFWFFDFGSSLLYDHDASDETIGLYGEYTKLLEKRHKDNQRFWNVPTDIM